MCLSPSAMVWLVPIKTHLCHRSLRDVCRDVNAPKCQLILQGMLPHQCLTCANRPAALAWCIDSHLPCGGGQRCISYHGLGACHLFEERSWRPGAGPLFHDPDSLFSEDIVSQGFCLIERIYFTCQQVCACWSSFASLHWADGLKLTKRG